MDFSLVVPAHNEQARIGVTIVEYWRVWGDTLRATGETFELIVVANGCTDGTPWLVRFLATSFPPPSPVRLLTIAHPNKGLAVVEGFRAARGQVVGFTDADGAVDPQTMLRIMRKAGEGTVAIGSKYVSGAECRAAQPLVRRVASRGWNLLVRMMFGLKLRDTQMGAKAFPAECVRAIVDRVHPCNFAFDVSLLWEAQKAGYRIVELPVPWEHLEGSTFSLVREVPRMFWALLCMRLGIRRQRLGEHAVAEEAPLMVPTARGGGPMAPALLPQVTVQGAHGPDR